MTTEEYRQWAHRLVDWTADYYQHLGELPVKSQVKPGDILQQLPSSPPEAPEAMEAIWEDFQSVILPGITHWQHPGFMAYFPASASFPSLLAEMLTASLAAQCMIWDTSPAAAELEELAMNWFRDLLGLPPSWEGVIQSTASEATLCALLTARERATNFHANRHGLQGQPVFRVYASEQIHSSIEKGIKIAGLGSENFVRIGTDEQFALQPEFLEAAIQADLQAGFVPLCIIAGLGTTGSTAVDPLSEIAAIASRHGIWLHVDAAYAGSALLLEEYRPLIEGIELADSFVVNPHKWLLTHFDCSSYFVKDPAALRRTFEILPEYLKTAHDKEVNNYRDWGIPLGRRFRALKLWFVFRAYGRQGLQQMLRSHMSWARNLERKIGEHPDFKLLAPVTFNLLCFRYQPASVPPERWNDLNQAMLSWIQQQGRYYLSHTMLRGKYAIRLVAGNAQQQESDVQGAWNEVLQAAEACLPLYCFA